MKKKESRATNADFNFARHERWASEKNFLVSKLKGLEKLSVSKGRCLLLGGRYLDVSGRLTVAILVLPITCNSTRYFAVCFKFFLKYFKVAI